MARSAGGAIATREDFTPETSSLAYETVYHMSLRTHGIAHFSIPVSDMPRSVAFYGEILGLEKVLDAGHLVFFRSGRDHVVLAKSSQVPGIPAQQSDRSEHVHHAFIVESRDYEESVAFLKSKNVQVFLDDMRPQGAVFAGRSTYFYDPDGNVLEIIDLQAMAYRAVGPPPAH
jgi:catechol 2,3-dioxygenase-like lactoylglutathione lyase family enzyme